MLNENFINIRLSTVFYCFYSYESKCCTSTFIIVNLNTALVTNAVVNLDISLVARAVTNLNALPVADIVANPVTLIVADIVVNPVTLAVVFILFRLSFITKTWLN